MNIEAGLPVQGPEDASLTYDSGHKRTETDILV